MADGLLAHLEPVRQAVSVRRHTSWPVANSNFEYAMARRAHGNYQTVVQPLLAKVVVIMRSM